MNCVVDQILELECFDNSTVGIQFKSEYLSNKQITILSSNTSIVSYTITDSCKTVILQLPFICSVFSVLFDDYDSWAHFPINISIIYYSLDDSISKVMHISNMLIKSRTIKDHIVTLVLSDR